MFKFSLIIVVFVFGTTAHVFAEHASPQEEHVERLKEKIRDAVEREDEGVVVQLWEEYVELTGDERGVDLAEEEDSDYLVKGPLFIMKTLFDQGRYSLAEPICKRFLAYFMLKFGSMHVSLETPLLYLGQIYQAQGLYTEAEEMIEYAAAIVVSEYGRNDIRITESINAFASLYYDMGRYKEAETLFWHGIDIYKQAEESHPSENVTAAFFNLATLYREQGRYVLSMEAYNAAMEILKSSGEPSSYMFGRILRGLAELHRLQGEYSEAEDYFLRALKIFREKHGYHHLSVGNTLNNLALLYFEKGHYAKSEEYYEHALWIYEKANLSEHPHIWSTLNNLAVIFHNQGRYSEAKHIYQTIFDSQKQLHKQNPGLWETMLNNLAGIHTDQGNYNEAESLYKRSLEISRNLYGNDPQPSIGTDLNNLAIVYHRQGKHSKAAQFYQQALEIYEQALKPTHPLIGSTLNNLGTLHYDQGYYEKAENSFKHAMDILKPLSGESHPYLGNTLKNLMLLYYQLGHDETLKFAKRSFETESAVLDENFLMLSERQRMEFTSFRGDLPLRISSSLAIQKPDVETVNASWMMTLRSKGRVLDAMLEDQKHLAEDPEAQSLYDRLSEIKKRITHLIFQDQAKFNEKALEKHQEEIKELREKRDAIEQRLARLSGRFQEGRRASQVTTKDVANVLNSETALVEFLCFQPLERAEEQELLEHYVAFVLKHGETTPSFITLGEADIIDRQIKYLRRKMQDGEPATDALRTLYKKIWAPLESELDGKKHVFVSPDGELNFLPFAALLGPDSRYLAENYTISYLASGRDLIRQSDTENEGASLFGDPAFGEGVPPLPNTRKEVQAIAGMLGEKGKDTQIWLGGDATTQQLKSVRRPDVLHLATHGYFLSDIVSPDSLPEMRGAMQMAQSRLVSPGIMASGMIKNPMHRSLLAMAGASGITDEGEPGEGIITAEEVGGLDLWGTRLVVLSACETAMGDAAAGEGVMGLRRAFVQAGAQNLVMTLWPVEDEKTADLMIEFYRRYLEHGNATRAMTETQRDIINQARENNEDLHPRDWAAFVVSVQGNSQSE